MALDKMYAFLNRIGVSVEETSLEETDCFVPGLKIKDGKIQLDKTKLKYPGDLIHEAGHIAVVPSEERAGLNGPDIEHRPNKDGEEIAALLWSYLATQEMEIDPKVVFHPHGYKGDSQWLIDTFESKNYVGAPLLEWMGIINWSMESNDIQVIQWLRD